MVGLKKRGVITAVAGKLVRGEKRRYNEIIRYN